VKPYKICAVLVFAVLAISAMAVPIMAKNGDGPGKADSLVLYLSGTPREMGVQYGSIAKDAISENMADFWKWTAAKGLVKDDLVDSALQNAKNLPPAVVEELKGMAQTSGVSYGELLAFNQYGDDEYEQRACTNFVAAGSATEDGRAISSKNRDLNNIQVLFFVEPEVGYKYIGMMSAGAVGISQGINEMGVAIGHTWMPVPEFYEEGYTPFILNQMVMEQCADAGEAVAFLESAPKGEGATFTLSDPNVAAIVETVPSVLNTPDAVSEIITDGASVHTNHYVFEPFYSWVLNDGFGYMWTVSYARYDRGLELLAENSVLDAAKVMSFTRDLENWGCGSPEEVIEVHPEVPDDVWSNGWPGFSICNARTVSACVFQGDIGNPEELSVMWMAPNNPAWCPYIPLHNGMLNELTLSGEMLADYVDGTAWKTSAQMRSLGDWGDLIPVFEAWEADKAVENAATETTARALLAVGDVEAACLLLTEGDGAIAQDAMALMEGLFDGTIPLELIAVPEEF